MPRVDRPDQIPAVTDRPPRLRSVALGLGTVAILSAGAVLVHGAVTTASARISGSTENTSSVLQAAVVELDDGGAGQSLLFDPATDNLGGMYPGLVSERCIAVRYAGSLPTIALTLSAEVEGGNGLERFVATAVTAGTGTDPGCGDFTPSGPALFTDTLAQLATRHASYRSGLVLVDLADEEWAVVRLQFEVVDDNDAQSRSTQVIFRFEVRP